MLRSMVREPRPRQSSRPTPRGSKPGREVEILYMDGTVTPWPSSATSTARGQGPDGGYRGQGRDPARGRRPPRSSSSARPPSASSGPTGSPRATS
ncbi:MAG: hypothetical protein MZV64_64210 [Ignavibacteriales bacterium]|nr:hypothetical protein [Ignavibacteriales bacterium]